MKISLELQPILKTKSGVGWYSYEIIRRLCERNVELQGSVFNFLNRNNIDSILKEFNFEIEVCSFMPYTVYRRTWNCFPVKYNHLFKSNADIYHFINFIVPPRVDGKVIVTVYDMVYKTFPETMHNSNFKRLEKNLKYSVDRADIIITISENSKKEIAEYLKVRPDKIEIVPPGVEFQVYNKEFSKTELEKIKEKYNLPEEYVLYLGTLEPRKNIESIIDAFGLYKQKRKNNLKLVIAGNKGWMYDSIFKRVKDLNIENEVIFTGYVDEEDKPCIYKMSRIFLFPSLYEGFGMPVLEAMASGVPVITSNTSSLPEVCGDAAVLVEPKDISSICDGIIRLQEDYDFRQQLVEQGFMQCKKFTWERSVEKLIKVYEILSN